ncbi:MAG: type II secretion system minor pseudopilin GspI [Candidatus Competibacterales bacterium]|nr:type II secretion system minor pseudopilin GspI [Candidatus Competibacterales bacterium]
MSTRGFTLLEVLVALAVLAIGLGALIRAAGDSAEAQAELNQRTVASWVADNVVAELRLARHWPEPGSRRSGQERVLEQDWHWQATFSATPEPDLRRIDLSVQRGDSDEIRLRLTAFLGRY